MWAIWQRLPVLGCCCNTGWCFLLFTTGTFEHYISWARFLLSRRSQIIEAALISSFLLSQQRPMEAADLCVQLQQWTFQAWLVPTMNASRITSNKIRPTLLLGDGAGIAWQSNGGNHFSAGGRSIWHKKIRDSRRDLSLNFHLCNLVALSFGTLVPHYII